MYQYVVAGLMVGIPDAPDLSFPAERSITIEAWVRPLDGGTYDIVCKQNPVARTTNYTIAIDELGALYLAITDSGGTYWRYSAVVPFAPGEWHHVALTHTFGTGRAAWYLDGQPISGSWSGSSDAGHAPAVGSDPVQIGGWPHSPWGGRSFPGNIDEVRIWNVARTAAQIAADFSHTIDPASPGLVAYYRMDDLSGDVARDLTLNHHDGSLEGSARIMPARWCCPADFRRDGVVNSQDFFDFLTAFFAEGAGADFNGDNVINSQDFVDFLSAFFVRCE